MRIQHFKPFTSSRSVQSPTVRGPSATIARNPFRIAPRAPEGAPSAAAADGSTGSGEEIAPAAAAGPPPSSSNVSNDGPASSAAGKPQRQPAWVPPTSILKISPQLLEAGGLNPSLEGPAAQASFAAHLASLFVPVHLTHPGLRILNIDPPVLLVHDFLTSQQCDDIMQAATDSGLMRRSGVGAAYPAARGDQAALGEQRTSSTLAATAEILSQHPRLSAALGAMLGAARALLRGPLPPEGTAAFSRPNQPGQMAFELPQVARYQQGQHFLIHEDAFPLPLAAAKGFQRRATLLTYLNDCSQGGATRFDVLDIAVQPVKGSALLFFPSFANGVPDARTLHTAQDAVTDKWVTQLWLSCGLGPAAAAAGAAAGARAAAAAGQPGQRLLPGSRGHKGEARGSAKSRKRRG